MRALNRTSACLATTIVLLLPTLADSMARAVLEAMACGLPVITTRESGYAGILRDGVDVLFVPARDAGAIAAALRRLSGDDALYERLARNGRAKALELTWDHYRLRAERLIDGRLAPFLGSRP
ncbi:MAG: glycosyltransferase [Tepidiformaceae bacterium]